MDTYLVKLVSGQTRKIKGRNLASEHGNIMVLDGTEVVAIFPSSQVIEAIREDPTCQKPVDTQPDDFKPRND